MKRIKIYFVIMVVFAMALQSCTKMDVFPSDQITTGSIPETADGILNVTNGNYSMFKDVLEFNGFKDETQLKAVGRNGQNDNGEKFITVRNRALSLLVKYGFNDENLKGTRLALATNPVTKQNIDEIFTLYTWARERNIYCVVTPSMMSGFGSEKLNSSHRKLVDLYVKIYQWNIRRKLQTLDQIRQEGIAAYAGGAPCNQVSSGMYVTLTGKVLRCPGREGSHWEEGDLGKNSLAEIWRESKNRAEYSGVFNAGCPAKLGQSIPEGFFEEVLRILEDSK